MSVVVFFPSRLCRIFPIVDCAAFLCKSCTLKTSTLCVATYIYTYSGDAPMNARWVQLLCMIYTFITNQYKSMASLKLSSGFSCLCCGVEVAANPLLATYAHRWPYWPYVSQATYSMYIMYISRRLLCISKQFLSSVNFECGVVLEILISSINVHTSKSGGGKTARGKGSFFLGFHVYVTLKSNFGADLSDWPRSGISGE